MISGIGVWHTIERPELQEQIVSALRVGQAAGASVLIQAEAGMGKTTLVESCLPQLTDRHHIRLYCVESGSQIAYFTFNPLLGDLGPDQRQPATVLQHILARLEADSGDKPVLLFIEDVHWIDPWSLSLLSFLLSSGRVQLVLTSRQLSQQPELFRLVQQGILTTMQLPRLSAQESASLIQKQLPGVVSIAVITHLQQLSLGNILVLRALLQQGVKTGAIAEHEHTWILRAPLHQTSEISTLDPVISTWLDDVDARDLELLQLLSIFEMLPLDYLLDDFDQARLERLANQWLLEIDGAYARLSHETFARVVRQRMTQQDRDRLWQLASTDDELRSHVTPSHLLLAAHHGHEVDDHVLFDSAKLAHEQYMLDLSDELLDAMARPNAESINLRVLNKCVRGDYAEGLDLLRRYIRDYETADDIWKCQLYEFVLYTVTLDDHKAAHQWLAAHRHLPEHVITGAELILLAFTAQHVEFTEKYAVYTELPNVTDDSSLKFAIDVLYTETLTQLGRGMEGIRLGQQLIRQAPDMRTEIKEFGVPTLWRVLYLSGLWSQCLQILQTERVLTPQLLIYRGAASEFAEAILLLGDLKTQDALGHIEVALAHTSEFDFFDIRTGASFLHRVLSKKPIGRLQIDEFGRKVAQSRYSYQATFLGYLRFLVEVGRSGHFEQASDALLATSEVMGREHRFASQLLALGWYTLLQLEKVTTLGQVKKHRDTLQSLLAVATKNASPLGEQYANFAQALLAGDGEQLVAIGSAARQQGHGELAVCAARIASILARKNRDVATLRLATELHSHYLPAHSEAAANDKVLELTARESQVMHLAATGHSNVEIARQLGLSVRTIEAHLRNIFMKLNITSRHELAEHVS